LRLSQEDLDKLNKLMEVLKCDRSDAIRFCLTFTTLAVKEMTPDNLIKIGVRAYRDLLESSHKG